ncbi:MAG: SpoIIE family protein phosphatase [bacterium]|nr:SpoIIE family protein phosphatase [bacterium]
MNFDKTLQEKIDKHFGSLDSVPESIKNSLRDFISDVNNDYQKFKKANQQYLSIINDAPYPIAIHVDGILVFVNKTGLRFSQAHAIDDIIGKPINEFIHPDHIESVNNQLRQLKDGLKRVDAILEKLILPDGMELDIEMTSSLITFNNQEAILVTGKDVTEENRAQKILQERNESIEKDLKTAHLIQQQLVEGSIPDIYRLKACYRYLPLDEVGGDYFSFTFLDKSLMSVFIGDVAGHGVTAALYLSLVKATTERLCREYALEPEEYTTMLNRELLEYMPLSFLTASYGLFHAPIDKKTVDFTFTSAGHPPIIRYCAKTKEVDFLQCKGTVIGLLNNITFEEKKITLHKGDRLFLYTDGIPETRNPAGNIYTYSSLPALVKKAQQPSLEKTLDTIINEIDTFREDQPFDDDIVLIGFEITD